MNRLRPLMALVLSVIAFTACNTEFNEITPTYAVPLINSKLGVYQLLAKADSNFIRTDEQGMITLVYGNDLLELPAKEVIKFLDVPMATSVEYTEATVGNFTGTKSITGTVDLSYLGVTIEELYRLLADSGNLAITMSSPIKHDIDYQLTFSEVEAAGGGVLTYSNTSTYTSDVNHNVTSMVSLVGADMDFSINNTTYSKLRVSYNITLRGRGGALASGERVSFSFGLKDIIFNQVEGYLGQQTIPLPEDSVAINLFQFTDEQSTSNSGNFAFTDPGITLEFDNSMTLPIRVNVAKMALSRSDNGQQSSIVFNGGFQNPFSINYPLVPTENRQTSVVIDRTNSNLKDLISPVNKKCHFKFDVITNPTGNTGRNKFSNTSKLGVKANITLPMAGYGYNWILADTTNLGVSFNAEESLKSGLIRLNIDNNFPMDVDLQVYFLDGTNTVVDSLFDNGKQFLKSPPLDATGKVIGSVYSSKDIPADATKMKNLTGSAKIAVVAKIQTADAQNHKEVRIYESNYIAVKMGVKAELSITKP